MAAAGEKDIGLYVNNEYVNALKVQNIQIMSHLKKYVQLHKYFEILYKLFKNYKLSLLERKLSRIFVRFFYWLILGLGCFESLWRNDPCLSANVQCNGVP